MLAVNTNYATMVSAPVNSRNTLKFIQLSQVDQEQIVAVIVMNGNVIKNKIIQVGEVLAGETLLNPYCRQILKMQALALRIWSHCLCPSSPAGK